MIVIKPKIKNEIKKMSDLKFNLFIDIWVGGLPQY